MNRRIILSLSAITALGLAFLPGPVFAQQKSLKEQIVGTWSFVSAIDTKADGTKEDRWGPNPKGTLMFDANGRYMQVITRSDIPKFAANKLAEGTAAEYKAVVMGMVVSFGTYSINESDKTLISRVEGAIYPNIIGAEQKRIISSLTADELKYSNLTASIGATAAAHWKRAK